MFRKLMFATAWILAAVVPSTAFSYTQDQIDEAVLQLRYVCQPLGGAMWNDLRDIETVVDENPPDHYKRKGWKKSITLRVRVADDPTFIPKSSPLTGAIPGHRLYFGIGGGKNPGVFASKSVTKFLCGFPGEHNGNDVFVPIPNLKFLK